MQYKETVEKWLEQASDAPFFGTIYLDIDWLIVHNDCFGPVHGDQTIERISSCIASVMQSVDHQCMRVGGEKFIVIMHGEAASLVFDFAEKLREAVESLAIPMVDDAYRKQYPHQHRRAQCIAPHVKVVYQRRLSIADHMRRGLLM